MASNTAPHETPPYTAAYLRQRFNPDGSPTRRVQERCTEILLVFDAICRKHNIPYWLSSGTMLGAVRHGGFIPWDDDLDVDMLRSDYLKLLKILPQELPDHLKLQTHDTDPGYCFCFAKIRDTRSYLEETNDYDRIFQYRGVYIDIFPYEKMPTLFRRLAGLTFGQIYRVLKNRSLSSQQVLRYTRWIYQANTRFVFPVLRFLAQFSTRKILNYSLGIPFDNAIYPHEAFPQNRVPFDNIEAPIPNGADTYLRRVYGNYMDLPDLDKLQTHIKSVRFDD